MQDETLTPAQPSPILFSDLVECGGSFYKTVGYGFYGNGKNFILCQFESGEVESSGEWQVLDPDAYHIARKAYLEIQSYGDHH